MPPITFGGVGSGIDTEAIISGLLSASQGPISRVRQQNTAVQSAVSSMSDVGSLLAKLKDSLVALDTVQEVGSFKAESDGKAVVATATGSARAGSFQIEVVSLASAYKAYSNALGVTQSSQALNQSGILRLSIGDQVKDVGVAAGSSLDQVIADINASGLRVAASSFFDGNEFRLQLRGLDTGAENEVTVAEFGGLDLGFAANVKSNAADAVIEIDDFQVTSKTNQVQGAIAGVTLALVEKTTAPVTINVTSDPEAFQTKVKNLVDSYNAVINKVHTEAGFGSIRANNKELSGDSTLRSVTTRLNAALTQAVGSSKFSTLRSIGVELNNNGTLKLNTAKLAAAVAADPDSVTRVLAGDDGGVSGITDVLAGVTADLLSPTGLIATRKDGLSAKQRLLADRVELEQRRLDRMEAQLRKQFTEMDGTVAANQAQLNFLQR